MRDIVIAFIVFGSLPFILRASYVGVLVWSWLSYMNPHRLSWGFAYDFPFAQIVALTLLVSLVFNKEPKRIPLTSLTILWILFILWMCLTSVLAIFPDSAQIQLIKVLKIQLITFITIIVITTKERLILLLWVIVLSLGFFGVKGGIFSLLTAGRFRIWGPEGSFIEDNNALATTLLMLVPLIYYLQMQYQDKWMRLGLLATMGLCGLSAMASYSRGAFLAAFAMSSFLWLKSKKKLIMGLAIILIFPLILAFMPDQWHARMSSIQTYEEDGSAMGRINAWTYSVNLANTRLTGGGFESWSPVTFRIYAPNPDDVHAAHSIYFGVLGDHGWPGLIMFVGIFMLAWRTGSWIIRQSKGHEELVWLADLVRMIQVSLVAYASGGMFLSLSYFDLPWHLVAILVIGKEMVKINLKVSAAANNLGPAKAPILSLPTRRVDGIKTQEK